MGRRTVFGMGGGGAIRVVHSMTDSQVSFNDGASVVVSVNAAVTDALSLIASIDRLLTQGNAKAVAFETFAVDVSFCAIEIGSRVPHELVEVVLSVCAQNRVPLASAYCLDADVRFGYCQRIYVGSATPTGVPLGCADAPEFMRNCGSSLHARSRAR
jgi:hypothetical protein